MYLTQPTLLSLEPLPAQELHLGATGSIHPGVLKSLVIWFLCALVLTMLALVDPGDEVICFDPYFVMYPALVRMAGGTCVMVDTYPDFRIDLEKVAAAISPRTKLILLNS